MPQETDEEITITVSGVSPDLLRKIDKLAQLEDRSRSAFIRRELEQAVERKKIAKEASAAK